MAEQGGGGLLSGTFTTGGGSKSSNENRQGTSTPWDFLYGTGSLFPFPNTFGAWPQLSDPFGFRGGGGVQNFVQLPAGMNGPGQMGQQSPALNLDPNKLSVADVTSFYGSFAPDKAGDLPRMLKEHGYDQNEDLTLDQWTEVLSNPFGGATGRSKGIATSALGRLQQVHALRTAAQNNYGAGGPQGQQGGQPQQPAGPPMPGWMQQQLASSTASGLNWNQQTQQWEQATGRPDVTWDSQSNTYYYNGQPLSAEQYQTLAHGGPRSLQNQLPYGYQMPDQYTGQYAMGTAQGLSWDPQQNAWVQTTGRPDIVWDAPSNTYYYKGQPISAEQQQVLAVQGPAGLMGQGQYQIESLLSELRQQPQEMQWAMDRINNTPQITAQTPQIGQLNTAMAGQVPTAEWAPINFQATPDLLMAMRNQRTDYLVPRLEEQQDEARRRTEGTLARQGLSGLAAANALERDVEKPYNDRIYDVYKQASDEALTQWYGVKERTAIQDAQMRQQASLANAGMGLAAQEQALNALNQRDIARAQMATQAGIAGAELDLNAQRANLESYLSALNIPLQFAQSERNRLFSVLGLLQQDQQQGNQLAMQTANMMLNQQLQWYATLANAGQYSWSRSDQQTDPTQSYTLGIV